MKTLTSILIATAILATAYIATFGIPVLTSDSADKAPVGNARQANAPQRNSRETAVELGTLVAEPYSNILRAIGSAKSLHSTTVLSTGSGEVMTASMKANESVLVGDIMLQLNDSSEKLEVEIAEAELQQALATAGRYERAGGGTITQLTLQDANADVQFASGNLKLAQIALAERTIRAPIAGRLGLSSVAVGDYLSTSDEIVTIDNTDKLIAVFEVPERSIGMLEIGAPVLVGTPVLTGRTFTGTITAFDSRLDTLTRSVTVEAEIENPDNRLWSGMTFTVRIINQTSSLPVVPATAITWNRSGAGIWTVNNNVATRQAVTILYRQGTQVWIEIDQPLGTTIVTEGAQKLRDGSTVRQVSSDTPSANS